MEFLLMAVVLHALCLSQGLRAAAASSVNKHVKKQSGLHTFSLSKACSGTLRARRNDSWVPVTLKLSLKEKNVTAEQICRELGCGGITGGLEFRQNSMASINTCLTECIIRNSTLHNCTAAAASNCSKEVVVECEHQAVRLAAGHDRCAGRVELMDAGRWGSVCDDDWNRTGGDVVCAQLGCGTAVDTAGYFGPGTGPIHISKLNCTGNESNLWQCSTQKHEDSNYCGHKEDAGVVCSGSTTVTVLPINTTKPSVTNWTTGPVTVMLVQDSSSSSLSGPVWGCIVLSVALLLVLLSNAVLCKNYKRRNACVIHQRHLNSYTGEDGDINNLQVVAVQASTYGEREARRPSLEDDSETSSGSDYEPYQHFGPQSLANMNNLHSLDDAPVVGECNQAQERLCKEENVLKNTTGYDVDSESTSSGECYENTPTEQEQLLNPDGNQFYPEHSLQTAPFLNTSQSANRTHDVDSESTSSGECYENTPTEQEQLLNPDGNQFYPEHSLQTAPFLNTSQSANRTHDVDSESTSSGECYENTPTEQEQLLNPDGNQFYPEHSLQTAPFLNTSQSANRTQESSDSDSTSSGECYENLGLEAEAFVQTFEGSPSLPEQNPLSHHTPQPTGNSNLFIPSPPNQDDSSTSSDEAYENVPDIDEENCESSSSSDYDDVANW